MNNTKKVMTLPSNCEKMTLEEMMKNESGWYLNLKTGEMFITYKDINSTVNWIASFIGSLGGDVQSGDITNEVYKLQSVTKNQSEMSGGIGIRVDDQGFKMFALSDVQIEKANSNTIVF